MKPYIILFLLYAFSFPAAAQQDSSAYEIQRRKINALLDTRSKKFGQYDQSLVQRTGIFGLKTKKDMQQSINILTEIVKTDNAVFRELKILLDYKDLEKTQAQGRVYETESRVINYMTTITRLQQQNEKLKYDLEKLQNRNAVLISILTAFILIVLGACAYLYRKNKLTFN